MFFILSKTLSYLFTPVAIMSITGALFIIFRRSRYKKVVAFLFISIFLLFTNDFIANFLLLQYQEEPKELHQVKPTTYGVLLTGMTNTLMEPESKFYFNQNADRLLQTIQLFSQNKFDTLIISGGGATALREKLQEARILFHYLGSINMDLERVIFEDSSRNTHESALFLANYLNGKEVTLISSASHIPRASACFKKEGVLIQSYPAVFYTNNKQISPSMFIPSAEALLKWKILLKEWQGLLAYKLMGYI